MADLQVTCIDKEPRYDPYDGIIHLGGKNWKWTRIQVIELIEKKVHTFYTLVGGKRAEVVVVRDEHRKYVKTADDDNGGVDVGNV